MGRIAILNKTGHAVAEWDPALPETVDEARVKFSEMLGQGFAAFRVVAQAPEKSVQIRKFEPEAETILMVGPKAGG